MGSRPGGEQLPLFTPAREETWPARARAKYPPTDWRSAWGHICERCGHDCLLTDHHVACCGTESQHRGTVGTYCTGHPCPACQDRAHAIAEANRGRPL